MSKLLAIAHGAIALFFVAPIAWAQPSPTLVTIDEALALAERFNPRIGSARARVAAAESGMTTAGQYPNPELEATSGGVRARAPGIASGRGASISIAQPIELGAVRESRMRGARSGRDAERALLEQARLELAANVRQAYLDVLQRKAETDLAIGTESLLAQIRNRVEVRVRVGEAPKLELTRADAELERARLSSASARLRVNQALAQLRTTIGAPLPTPFDVAPIVAGDPPLPELAILRNDVETRHPSLAASRAAIERAQARLENERAQRTPQPTLIAGIDRQPETQQFLLGVALPLPLFNRREGQIGEAVAALNEARASFDAQRVDLLGALEVAYQRWSIAGQQIETIERALLPLTEAALNVAEAAFRFGERGFIEVLDAQRVLRQVRADLIAARFERQVALLDIERLRSLDIERFRSLDAKTSNP